MRKTYTSEFKAKVILEVLREEQTLGQIARKYEIHPNQITRWRKAVVEGMPELLEDKRKKESEDKENQELVQELYAQIGELTAKLNWLKKNLGFTLNREQRIAMLEKDGGYSLSEQCELLSIRQTSLYYRPRGNQREEA